MSVRFPGSTPTLAFMFMSAQKQQDSEHDNVAHLS